MNEAPPLPEPAIVLQRQEHAWEPVYGRAYFNEDQLRARDAMWLARIEEAVRDAARYRWLREHACNQLYVERDGDHACNYMTAAQWIEMDHNDDFKHVEPAEVQRMKDTNTIWKLQIYPNTPVGFNIWYGATLDSVVDAAIRESK